MSKRMVPPRTEIFIAPKPVERKKFSMRLIVAILLLALGVAGFIVSTVQFQGEGWWQLLAYAVTFALLFSGGSRLGKYFKGDSFDLTTWMSLVWIILITTSAVLAPILPLGEYKNSALTLADPVLARPDLLSNHLFGTNNLGLDMFARVIYGARVSLVVALTAVGIGIIVGGALGIFAGFYRKITDRTVSIFTNSLLAVPPLILLIALASVLDPNIMNLSFALSLMALPSMIRISRANTLAFVQREFVLAGKSMGASNMRLMFKELLPNVILPLASYAMVMVSVLIVAEASLSFLGLGIPQPTPTWGNMIAEGEGRMFQKAPHLVLVPGLVLFMTVFAFNILGEKARARFDTRQAKV